MQGAGCRVPTSHLVVSNCDWMRKSESSSTRSVSCTRERVHAVLCRHGRSDHHFYTGMPPSGAMGLRCGVVKVCTRCKVTGLTSHFRRWTGERTVFERGFRRGFRSREGSGARETGFGSSVSCTRDTPSHGGLSPSHQKSTCSHAIKSRAFRGANLITTHADSGGPETFVVLARSVPPPPPAAWRE